MQPDTSKKFSARRVDKSAKVSVGHWESWKTLKSTDLGEGNLYKLQSLTGRLGSVLRRVFHGADQGEKSNFCGRDTKLYPDVSLGHKAFLYTVFVALRIMAKTPCSWGRETEKNTFYPWGRSRNICWAQNYSWKVGKRILQGLLPKPREIVPIQDWSLSRMSKNATSALLPPQS